MKEKAALIKTEVINLDKIIPYENNPRDNENAINAVVKSIERYGYMVPIVLDKNNVITAGHTRFEALKLLDFKSCSIVRAEDLSPEQIAEFRVMDNKIAELASWDWDKLEIEFAKFADDFDASQFDCDFGLLKTNEGVAPVEVNEGIVNSVKTIKCPECGHEFPK